MHEVSLPDSTTTVERCSRASAAVPADPVFILAPPRSFTSVVGAMLGQHPQLYGLPALELFSAETVGQWWELCAKATFPQAHGTLRAVAQLYFSAQTEATVKLARGWLRRRSHYTTGFLLEKLARQVRPRVVVEKSTSTVYKLEFMRRAARMFPLARFIHLVRHPRGHGQSVIAFLQERRKLGPIPAAHWLARLASYSETAEPDPSDIDPQRAWYALHCNISKFLESVPESQRLRVRGEDLLRDPDRWLGHIAAWRGLRTDAEAIEEMKHPERSLFACFGPAGARFGNDSFFLQNPALRRDRAGQHSLEGPLSWRADGAGFSDEVKALAGELGYH
jgi:hypothetical protein